MNPYPFAMRHPITMMMAVVALFGAGGLAVYQMRVDIFPPFNLPQIYIIQNFNGMSPAQIEGLIVNPIELNLQYVDGVQSVQSQSIQQIALIKVSFYPDTDMAQAMAAVVAQVNRAMAFMPAGVLPPQIMRMDAGSVPVGYLVLTSENVSLGRLADLAEQRIRPLIQSQVPGTVGTAPFGSNVRTIVVTVNPDRLRSNNLTPQDVTTALMAGNVVIPAGNLYVQGQMPMVPTNAMVGRDYQKEIGQIPLRRERNLYIRDVADRIADSTDINFGYAMVNGKRSVYVPVVKKTTASTLTVVSEIHQSMERFRGVLPEGTDIRYEFDASPTVVEAIRSVGSEGAIGAILTGLMVLIFLHDWRSAVVVIFNIPLALLGSLFALWCTGNTTNIMTLGGLALAIGILVDEATVTVENIHAQMEEVSTIPRAVRMAMTVTAAPRFLAMLCILSVFIPAFIMVEPVRSLFVPLSLAVGFAMISSYLLSSTLVPVLAIWLIKGPKTVAEFEVVHPHTGPARVRPSGEEAWPHPGWFGSVQRVFVRFVGLTIDRRRVVVPVYAVLCLLILVGVGLQLGRELFPLVDMGQFVLRFHLPSGTNYQLTRQAWIECLRTIEQEVGADNVRISMGFAGQQAPDFAMNNMILFMTGPDDGQVRVGLRPGSGVNVLALQEKLRRRLPERLVPWLAGALRQEGYSPQEAEERAGHLRIGFEPGDIVSQVMTFGSPTPLEVVIAGPDLNHSRAYADALLAELRGNPFLRDVQIHQTLDYPIVAVRVDRQKANLSGVTVDDVGQAVLTGTSSSRMLARNYWVDTKSGTSYQVQVQTPIQRMTSNAQVETLPIERVNSGLNLMVRDVSWLGRGVMPGEYDRRAMQRYLSITANIEGEDLGRAAAQIEAAIQRTGTPPRGVHVESRGQVAPMNHMFASLAIGLAIAVFVILVLLGAYFQSPRLAAVSLGAVPGVLCGVVLILFATGTTLNIESFMGAIMSIGVSVSNSVILVTFMAAEWQKGRSIHEAAIRGAGERLRPILMTACAMIVGMVPMSLGLEAGAKMEAPLGRAVIGGLGVSTFATLLILPSLFALVMGSRAYRHPSIDPEDLASPYFDEGEEASRLRRQEQIRHEAEAFAGPQPPQPPLPGGGPA